MVQAGQPFEPPMKGFSPGRGDRRVARSARPILRKPVEASRMRAHPADAFCPEAPCPRATTQAARQCQTLINPRRSRGFTLIKLTAECAEIMKYLKYFWAMALIKKNLCGLCVLCGEILFTAFGFRYSDIGLVPLTTSVQNAQFSLKFFHESLSVFIRVHPRPNRSFVVRSFADIKSVFICVHLCPI